MPPFENRTALSWLTNLSMKELRGALSRLPDHTVVLYLVMFQDAAGALFHPAAGAGPVRAREPGTDLRLL